MNHRGIRWAVGWKPAVVLMSLLLSAQTATAASMMAQGDVQGKTSVLTALVGAGYVYLLAILISFGVAMLIKLLGKALKQFKGEP